MISFEHDGLEKRALEAVRRLSGMRELDNRILIDLPIMYPSGAMAVVEVERNKDRLWVSDVGHGLVEAEFMGPLTFTIGLQEGRLRTSL